MSELDDKLKLILEDHVDYWHRKERYTEPLKTGESTFLEQIKQVFADEIGKMLEVQGVNGTWNYDSYMLGMYNGMEFCHSLVKDVEPKYREAPDRWLTSRPEYDGQSWYDNFVKALSEKGRDSSSGTTLFREDTVLEAAKKASGLTEQPLSKDEDTE